jgi:predicted transcriptional regulator
MKNPFEGFHQVIGRKREIPLDKILKSKEETLSKILSGYENLLKNEAKDLVWLMQYSTVIKAYSIAEKGIEGLEYTAEDIEEFCFALDRSDHIPY